MRKDLQCSQHHRSSSGECLKPIYRKAPMGLPRRFQSKSYYSKSQGHFTLRRRFFQVFQGTFLGRSFKAAFTGMSSFFLHSCHTHVAPIPVLSLSNQKYRRAQTRRYLLHSSFPTAIISVSHKHRQGKCNQCAQ